MIVNVKNLVKRYDQLIAVDHLNLEIQEGEIFGLLGPNGSGKTTTINCILSLLKYNKGSIEIFGKAMSPEAYDIKREIGVVFQNVAVFNELTVSENISYFCSLYVKNNNEVKKLTQQAISFVSLEGYVKYYPKKLSGGLLRRLNIACGIAHKPKLIILDEPTVAVDPQSRNKILEGIKELNQQGATIIYTTHYMEEAEQLCSRIAIMDNGKIIAKGTNEELKEMISTGEKITIEAFNLKDTQLATLKELPHIISVEYNNPMLHIKASKGNNNLIQILEYLSSEEIPFNQVFTEHPTLNDVFLEITGKELRD